MFVSVCGGGRGGAGDTVMAGLEETKDICLGVGALPVGSRDAELPGCQEKKDHYAFMFIDLRG